MKIKKLFIKRSKTECIIIYTEKENILIIPSGNKIHILSFKSMEDLYEAIVTKTLEVDFYNNVYVDDESEEDEEDEETEI